MNSDFKTRMYNYEVAPPSSAWQNIIAQLDGGARVIKMSTVADRTRSFVVTLAAASVTLFLLVNAFFFIREGRTESSAPANVASVNHVEGTPVQYVTLAVADGEALKVSSKVAAKARKAPDDGWSKKVKDWKDRMIRSSATSFLDVVQVASIADGSH
jgi:hypothetical protein